MANNLKNAQQHLKLPAAKCYTDRQPAFDENQADFAIIVVPPAHHEQVVDLALAHGLHILSEKPISDTMEACARIYRKVKAAGKKMAVTMSHRFDQDKQSLEREIKSGKYGQLNYVIGRNTWTCRKFASWGQVPSRNPGRPAHRGHGPSSCAECDQATLELDNRRLRVLSDLSGERVITEKPLARQDAWTNPWLAEMFCDWLRGERDNHPTNLDDNIQCAALLFAAIESAHTGRPVDVQEFMRRHLAAG